MGGWNSTLQAAWYVRHAHWARLCYVPFVTLVYRVYIRTRYLANALVRTIIRPKMHTHWYEASHYSHILVNVYIIYIDYFEVYILLHDLPLATRFTAAVSKPTHALIGTTLALRLSKKRKSAHEIDQSAISPSASTLRPFSAEIHTVWTLMSISNGEYAEYFRRWRDKNAISGTSVAEGWRSVNNNVAQSADGITTVTPFRTALPFRG